MNASSVLEKFINLSQTFPAKENEELLLTAYNLVKDELTTSNYSIESIRLAHKIFGYLGDSGLNERITLMRKYLHRAAPGRILPKIDSGQIGSLLTTSLSLKDIKE